MVTPPKINDQKFSRRLGRLKYMQSFYEKKLDLCEEKQRGLFEDLISALKYTITMMGEMKTYSDFYWSDDNASNRIEEAIDDTASEEADTSDKIAQHRKDLEELDDNE